ncbi:hypothetical protein Ndes2437A_g04899 [Nannochloris sp. 'desiccata']|nr:hypothetical protein KSW81_002941 [Chlorella desiccata (nom. nud.)]
MKITRRLTQVSAYSHGEDHLKIKTVHGGIVTLLGATLAVILFIGEAQRCLRLRQVQDMVVDTSIRPKMHFEYDLTFPALPCHAIRMDSGDVGGRFETESMHKAAHDGEIHKWRLDSRGKRIERVEYIAPKGRDNPFVMMLDAEDMNEVRDAVMRHEGCNIRGWLEVQRVAGNIHFAVRPEAIMAVSESEEALQALFDRHIDLHGSAHDEFHAMQLNASHIIHKLRFGPQQYPGQVQPLEGVRRIDRKATGVDKYFIKVVPTEWKKGSWGRKSIDTYQYSVTEYYTPIPEGARMMPGVFFLYDTWPIKVNVKSMRLGFMHLITRTAAVVGGVWAVTSVVDKIVHKSVMAAKKMNKPKASL